MAKAFSIKDRVIAIIQYGLLYYMLLLHGSVYFALDTYHDLMLGGMLLLDGALAAWFLYQQVRKQGTVDKSYLIFFGGVLAALGISSVSNGFSLGLFSILSIAGRLTFAYLVYRFDENHAANRFARLCSSLALISLVFYLVQLIDVQLLISFLPKYQYENEEGYILPVYSLVNTFGNRNYGMYTEPGRYQIVLGAVLFLLLQGRNKISLRNVEACAQIVITLLALISTKSTTGYFSLVIIFGLFLFEQNKGDIKRFYYWILGLGSVGVILDLLRGKAGLLYSNLINKILGDKSATGSAFYRVYSMKVDLEIVRKYPLGAGYRIYNKLLEDNIWDSFISCVGLTKCTATMGIQTTMTLLGGYAYFLWKNYKSVFARIAYILFFFNTTLAQPDIVYPVMIMVLLFKDQLAVESQENR